MRASIAVESGRAVRAILLFATVVFAPVTVHAQTVNLAWDASADPQVVGYTVHVGINPGVYGQTFDIAGRSTTTFAFPQVVPGQRYYFAVSAYDASNVSSAMSNVISWKTNVGPTLTQPTNQISSVGAATSLQLNATDDGDPLTYTASGLPAGLSVSTSTGLITGTPTTVGTFAVTVTVSDGVLSAARMFFWTINGRLSVTSLTSSVPSPQVAGASVGFTAAAIGGVSPYQYKFLQTVGTTTTVLRTWGTSATYSWAPTQAGTYVVTVWARSAGVTADLAEGSMTMNFVINPSPMSVTQLSSSVSSPQVANTAVTFTAAASGGRAPYQYKYLLTSTGGTTTVLSWSTSAQYTWTPTQAGSYVITVWVRSAGQTADVAEATRAMNYTVRGPLAVLGLTSNLSSPQVAGTSMTFTATATGGTAPYQYKFWIWSGSAWTVVRDWNGTNTFTWTPTQANSNYRVAVWVRNATTTGDVRDGDLAVPYVITSPAASPLLTVTGLTSNVPSPQVAGTSMMFTATATGGRAPYQYKFWIWNGNVWTVVRDWNGNNTFTWTPTQANSNYRVAVWVRNATTTGDVRDGDLAVPYVIASPAASPLLTVTGLTSNVPSPQVAGTSMTFTATATGGTAPYQYKFWISNGSVWTVVRDWNGSNTFTWTPTQSNNTYRVAVWVRNATTTADVRDGDLAVPYVITSPAAAPPLTVTALTSNLPSPQMAGTPVTFTATASGGAAPYQYKFWIWNGTVWTVVRDWNGSNTYSWTPTQANSNYRVSVWVRNATTTTDLRDGDLAVSYAIIAPGVGAPLTVTALTSNLPSPQTAGTPVTFSATGTGGVAPYQYKFWIWNGSVWTVVRDWNGSNTYTWTPTQANGNYRVAVWVRNATTTADVRDGDVAVFYAITAPGGTPLTNALLSGNLPAPQGTGTPLTLTAIPVGGSGSYQFKWWLWDGRLWSVQRDWSPSSTFFWTPTQANVNYRIGVWVREASSTADSSAINATMWFPIQP